VIQQWNEILRLIATIKLKEVTASDLFRRLNSYSKKQLDRIEHVHRFTRAVSVGNPREFLQAEKEDQEMAEACKRLIKSAPTGRLNFRRITGALRIQRPQSLQLPPALHTPMPPQDPPWSIEDMLSKAPLRFRPLPFSARARKLESECPLCRVSPS
jgi:Tn3 transposase DDE domain